MTELQRIQLIQSPEVQEARKSSLKMKPSRAFQKLQKHPESRPSWEAWVNNLYEVVIHRYPSGWQLNTSMPWARIGIGNLDGSARHDWRDMQAIKNQLVGDEWEAVEMFPRESRLCDPSNYFILWCAPDIPIGIFEPRSICHPEHCLAPQRPWPDSAKPPETGGALEYAGNPEKV